MRRGKFVCLTNCCQLELRDDIVIFLWLVELKLFTQKQEELDAMNIAI